MSHSSGSMSPEVETFLAEVYDIVADSVRTNPDKWQLDKGAIKASCEFASYGLRRQLHLQAYRQGTPVTLQMAGVEFRRPGSSGKNRCAVRTKEEHLTAQPDGLVRSVKTVVGFGLNRSAMPYVSISTEVHEYGATNRRIAVVDVTTQRRVINYPTADELQTTLDTVRRVCEDVNRLAPPPEEG